ncbi:class I SAM-dependent methyltransferase [Bacteriovoracaceae bacterium]|nr:class I SAM-dependent methyltransferase [Bacteriovoracaceae bacterium]
MHAKNIPLVMLQRECPLCDHDDVFPVKEERNNFGHTDRKEVQVFENTWVQLMQCRQCGFAFCKEIPSDPNFFEARYDIKFNPEFESNNAFKDEAIEHILQFVGVTRDNSSGKKLLDVGCFVGHFMSIASKYGLESSGIETNPTVGGYAKNTLNLDVFIGTVMNYNGTKDNLDFVTMIDVLEHLYRPVEVIEKLHEFIKPGGQLVIKVPNYHTQAIKQKIFNILGISDLGIFSNFGHINHFSKRSMKMMLDKIGFTDIEFVSAKFEMFSNNDRWWRMRNLNRRALYFGFRLLDILTGNVTGPNLLVRARKK